MSLHNVTQRILALVVALSALPAFGQVYHPFGDPLDVNPDWQLFAPVDQLELEELAPRQRARSGWFGSYDRTNLWVSRPDVEASANRGDFGWGNRYDVGFMSPSDSGWLFSFRNMGGPNVYDRVLVDRIDRQNPNDLGDPANPVLPASDRNDPQLGVRAYVLGDSLNVIGMTNFEINKTWRRSPYRYGGMIEPMFGFKFSTLNDTALNQDYFRDINLITTPGTQSTTTDIETLISDTTSIRNRMFGAQLGARWFNHSGRWTVSSEFRAFGMANFQNRRYEQYIETTEYDGVGVGSTVVLTDTSLSTIYESNTEFVYGFEARAEAAYFITQLFQVRGGIEVLSFNQGIWRGANPGFGDVGVQDQDVWMGGFTFGLQVNR